MAHSSTENKEDEPYYFNYVYDNYYVSFKTNLSGTSYTVLKETHVDDISELVNNNRETMSNYIKRSTTNEASYDDVHLYLDDNGQVIEPYSLDVLKELSDFVYNLEKENNIEIPHISRLLQEIEVATEYPDYYEKYENNRKVVHDNLEQLRDILNDPYSFEYSSLNPENYHPSEKYATQVINSYIALSTF
jgi:superfamily I DNA/RNA helicase